MKPFVITEGEYADKCEELSHSKTIKECMNNVAYFAKHMLGLELYAWQKRVADMVSAGRKKIIINTSRQIGKSKLVAVIALWALAFNKGNSGDGQNTKIGIISRSDDQAKKIIAEIRNLVLKGDAVMKSKANKKFINRDYFSEMLDTSQKAENTKMSITFRKGHRGSIYPSFVKSFPPTDAVLGNTFDFVFLDEASRIEDEIFYRAILPTGDKYNANWIVTSTPNGMSGFFYELMDVEEKRKNHEWDRYWFTIEAVKFDDPDHYSRKIKEIDQMIADGKELVAKQEYFAEFVATETSFFDPKDVTEMFDDKLAIQYSSSNQCTLGLDVGGQKKSHSVITITTCDDSGMIYRIFHKRYPVQGDDNLLDDIADLLKKFNLTRLVVEKCQITDFLIREMKNRGWNVYEFEPNREKVPAYSAFRAKLHKGLVKSYLDEDLMVEMKALTQKEGRFTTMIHAPTNYTDDMIDSLVMSAYFYTGEAVGAHPVDFDNVVRRKDEKSPVSDLQRLFQRIRNKRRR